MAFSLIYISKKTLEYFVISDIKTPKRLAKLQLLVTFKISLLLNLLILVGDMIFLLNLVFFFVFYLYGVGLMFMYIYFNFPFYRGTAL